MKPEEGGPPKDICSRKGVTVHSSSGVPFWVLGGRQSLPPRTSWLGGRTSRPDLDQVPVRHADGAGTQESL